MAMAGIRLARAVATIAASLVLTGETAPAPAAGEGVLCGLAIYSAVAEVGRQCFAERNLDFQSHVRHNIARIEAFVRANSAMTQADLEQFEHRQAPRDNACAADLTKFYQAFAKAGSAAIDQDVDRLIARPGPPTWGQCL